MKRKKFQALIAIVMCSVMLMALAPIAQASTVTLEVLNPKGNIELRQVIPLAERVDNLEGLKIGLFWYSKDVSLGGLNTYQGVLQLLQERFPTSTGTQVFQTASKSAVAYNETMALYEGAARSSDAAVFGIAN